MKNAQHFRKSLLESRKKATPEYGGNVMPALEAFRELSDTKEIRAYQDALELMLEDDDPAIRKFAVDLCLGFFVFRDVVE